MTSENTAESRVLENAIYIPAQCFLGDGVDVKVDVFRVTNTLPKETEIAPALEAIELLVDARAKLRQEKKMKLFYSLNIS